MPPTSSQDSKLRLTKSSCKCSGATARELSSKRRINADSGTGKRVGRKRTEKNRRDLCGLLEMLATFDTQMLDEVREMLTPYEHFLFKQVTMPNYAARCYAVAEQAWDEEADDAKAGPVDVHVEFEHMAKGLEMDLAVFEQVVIRIMTKLKSYATTDAAVERLDRVSLRQLESFFGIPQTPLSLDVRKVRQILTITARNHHREVTAEVAAMLEAVGAKLPQRVAKRLKRPERGLQTSGTRNAQ